MNFPTESLSIVLSDHFTDRTIARGRKYQLENRVTLQHTEETDCYFALVRGSHQTFYNVEIDLDGYPREFIEGICDCPVGLDCKHVVATLIELSKRLIDFPELVDVNPNEMTTPSNSDTHNTHQLDTWLTEFGSSSLPKEPTSIVAKAPDHQLSYLLDFSPHLPGRININLKLSRLLKAGGLGQSKHYSPSAPAQQHYLSFEDEEIISQLHQLNKHSFSYREAHYSLKLEGPKSSDALLAMLETKRTYWQEPSETPLVLTTPCALNFEWQLQPNGEQRLTPIVDHTSPGFIATLDKAWFISPSLGQSTQLETTLSSEKISRLLQMPPVPLQAITHFTKQLKKLGADSQVIPAPYPQAASVESTELTPTPTLQLSMQSLLIEPEPSYYYQARQPYYMDKLVANISFDYAGRALSLHECLTTKTLAVLEESQVHLIKRQLKAEETHLAELNEQLSLHIIESNINSIPTIVVNKANNDKELLDLSFRLSTLEAEGWHIIRDHPKLLPVIEEEDLDWFTELDEDSSYDYFGFKLGVLIDDERVNLLPAIADLLRKNSLASINRKALDERIPLALDNGKLLSVTFERLKPMVNTLLELYNSELSSDGSMRLSKWQATLLAEVKNAFSAAKLRWFGGDKIRNLSEQLSRFKGIKETLAPSTFKATLRGYQQEGVNWLQFLREYNLGGILADDMGLGKTVQTLAHLCIEKNKRRMRAPSLIVAPTSLMLNWRLEAERFAPNLKVLIFHGIDRHVHQASLSEQDVILTTYSLLVRDKAIWLNLKLHYLILDEAQFIKNARTKTTQIVQQLPAAHRLCLTGTPMENHLSELWSLFHFLMPGYLGDQRQFKKLYQTPIEKNNDAERRKVLAARSQPFILRRMKRNVLKELPEKTEIIQKVELSKGELDLYESIRLAMEKKVRSAIQDKGVARSHIIILDALLKLRQICCHPGLLKLSHAKKLSAHGSKLERLREMLPSMVEENRKILLFSQFTKMLGLIETMLIEEGLPYVKLTGATRNREKPIRQFQSGEVPIFLISLKAGGTGLNLTAADTVIHYDPWWNPAVEDQATDRAHRIGQTNAVFVYKLLAAGTIEETIQEMQQKKRQLVTDLLTTDTQHTLELSGENLATLFKPYSL